MQQNWQVFFAITQDCFVWLLVVSFGEFTRKLFGFLCNKTQQFTISFTINFNTKRANDII